MAFKLIHATQVKPGNSIVVEGVPCTVRTNDISTSGRHGHAKCRIEAVSIIDGKKKVLIIGGHDRLEVPMINKNNGQILSIMDCKVSLMDLTSYETLEVPISEELKSQIAEGDQVEYWNIEEAKFVKRKI